MIESLERLAGAKTAGLIERKSDEVISGIVANWPRNFVATRAESLGFTSEKSFDDIIRAHVEDELDGVWPEA